MNGVIKINKEWMNLEGAVVTDINGTSSNLTMLPDDKFYLQVHGSKRYGTVGVYFWHGVEPTSSNTLGAVYFTEGQQAELVKGIDDIYVRSLNGEIDLVIRKVQ